MRLIQLGTVVLFALALVPGGAHLLEMANKMRLDRDAYMIVQQIYQGWDLIGIEQIVAVIAAIVLSVLSRRQRVPFRFALAGSALLASSLVIFFIWTFPVNSATNNWTVMPENWMALRRQWEYSHAINTGLVFVALCCIVSSALAWKRPPTKQIQQ